MEFMNFMSLSELNKTIEESKKREKELDEKYLKKMSSGFQERGLDKETADKLAQDFIEHSKKELPEKYMKDVFKSLGGK